MASFMPPASIIAPGPPAHGFSITPSDTTVFANPTRYIWVGGTGAVAVLLDGDASPVTLSAVPAGTMLQLCAQKVMATGTTATLMVGMW